MCACTHRQQWQWQQRPNREWFVFKQIQIKWECVRACVLFLRTASPVAGLRSLLDHSVRAWERARAPSGVFDTGMPTHGGEGNFQYVSAYQQLMGGFRFEYECRKYTQWTLIHAHANTHILPVWCVGPVIIVWYAHICNWFQRICS